MQTGGTIDKDYPRTTKGYAFEFGDPAVIRVLERLNPSFEYEVLTAFQKDSLEITEDDRKKLTTLIEAQSADKIIVTHGTDTMMETATYLSGQIKHKLIIITGAMRPEQFSNSDAAINIGSAVAAANLLRNGIYIAMHGIVKPYDQIKRNMETGKYY